MLGALRRFSKTKYSGILIAMVIVPFVLWGMGSVFSGGNTNIVARVNNENISTQDFIDYMNNSGLDTRVVKDNIDNNIFEESLSKLISETLLKMEIDKLNVSITDNSLILKIKENNIFLDENNQFSRIKYEKFLLENNISATDFEKKLKDRELQKKLFFYINGGIKSPKFLVNKFFIEETKKIEIDFINLKHKYKSDFNTIEIDKYINKNKENLVRDYIDFSYVKINPQNLTESDEFNDMFFQKIDEIENLIIGMSDFKTIVNKYSLEATQKTNFLALDDSDILEKEIYRNRNNKKIQLLDKNDFYLLYEIKTINKVLPKLKDEDFKKQIEESLFIKNKYDFNKKIFSKIQKGIFNDTDFKKLSDKDNQIKTMLIKSIRDDNTFDMDSIKLLYSLPVNSFLLISDVNEDVYLAKIKNINFENIQSNQEDYGNYLNKSNIKIITSLYESYDGLLNNKYNIKIYNTTMDRVKNYFR